MLEHYLSVRYQGLEYVTNKGMPREVNANGDQPKRPRSLIRGLLARQFNLQWTVDLMIRCADLHTDLSADKR